MKARDLKEGMRGESKFLDMKKEGSYRVRIASEFLVFWKFYYENENKETRARIYLEASAIPADEIGDEQLKKISACYVIERATGRVKIAEFNKTISGKISDLSVTEGYEFDDVPTYDVIIKRMGTGLATKYDVLPYPERGPLDETERANVAAMSDLTEFYRAEMLKINTST